MGAKQDPATGGIFHDSNGISDARDCGAAHRICGGAAANAARGNIAKAARMAEKSRTEVYSLLKKHGLDPVRYKSGSPDENELM